MRSSSKRVARKGLELACFVGERLGVFPDETGASAFEWEQDGGEVDGEVDGAWVGRGDEDLFGEDEVWHDFILFVRGGRGFGTTFNIAFVAICMISYDAILWGGVIMLVFFSVLR